MKLAVHALAAGLLALALVSCAEEKSPAGSAAPDADAAEAARSGPGEESAPSAAPVPVAQRAEGEGWLLAEFDWGDSKNVVYETVHYTDGFICYRHKLREHCTFVKTRVDDEELVAKFRFVDDRLWRIDILTPDLDESQAVPHLERVWKLLADYVTRFYGEAPEQNPFPDWKALGRKDQRITHRWSLADQEIRVLVGRSPDDPNKWFTAARFVDPKWVKVEPPLEVEPEAPKR